jgi:hypothetical protein
MAPRTRIIALSVAGTTIVLAVAGCAFQRAETASQAQATMVGMSKEKVLACMGTPVRAGKAGATEVWTYDSGDNQTDSIGSASVYGGRFWGSAFGSITSVTRSCKIDVVMTQGHVTKINYSGLTGGLLTSGEECGYAVDNCVQPPGQIAAAPPGAVAASSSVDASSSAVAANDDPDSQEAPQLQSLDQWNKSQSTPKKP